MLDLQVHILVNIIISLACIGVNVTTWRDMVFHKFSVKVERLLIEIFGVNLGCGICYPLFKCPMCMSSLWSILFWKYFDYNFNLIIMILTVCGLNVILASIIDNIRPED